MQPKTKKHTQRLGRCGFGCCEQRIQYSGAFCTYLCTSQVLRWSRWRWGWGLTSSRALLMPVGAQYFRQTGNQILPNRKTGFSSRGSQRLGAPSSPHTPPRLSSLTHPTPCESPPFTSSPGLTEKDLPAKLEVFTISVTLTFRHVWSVSGAAVGVQWVGPETGKGEMRGCKWASREGGQLGMLCPKTDMNPP